MFCNKCGHEIADDSNFCSNCGEKFQKDPVVEDDKKDSIAIVIFIIIALLIGGIIAIYATIQGIEGNESPIISLGTRDATNDDIIANVENRILSIQASEKISNLVVEVKYLDKDKKILKTENINVGNIAPGNTFEYRLTLTGIQVPDLDKLKTFSIRVIEGTIKK